MDLDARHAAPAQQVDYTFEEGVVQEEAGMSGDCIVAAAAVETNWFGTDFELAVN